MPRLTALQRYFKARAKKAAATRRANDPDCFRKMGAKGGRAKARNRGTRR